MELPRVVISFSLVVHVFAKHHEAVRWVASLQATTVPAFLSNNKFSRTLAGTTTYYSPKAHAGKFNTARYLPRHQSCSFFCHSSRHNDVIEHITAQDCDERANHQRKVSQEQSSNIHTRRLQLVSPARNVNHPTPVRGLAFQRRITSFTPPPTRFMSAPAAIDRPALKVTPWGRSLKNDPYRRPPRPCEMRDTGEESSNRSGWGSVGDPRGEARYVPRAV